jgi:hypothetical protein
MQLLGRFNFINEPGFLTGHTKQSKNWSGYLGGLAVIAGYKPVVAPLALRLCLLLDLLH